MEQRADWRNRARTILLWVVTILISLGIGLAGLTKFTQPDHWQSLFAGWGYPRWFASVVGVLEVVGAIGLLIPRLAFYGAMLLMIVMMGALITLLSHRGGPLGWGATPTVYLVLLSLVGAARWKQRTGSAQRIAEDPPRRP
jgi:uncharacterized membrane protein YphA (DoxX/SURF4 family)